MILSDNEYELGDYKPDSFFDTICCLFYATIRLQINISNTPENNPNPKGARTFYITRAGRTFVNSARLGLELRNKNPQTLFIIPVDFILKIQGSEPVLNSTPFYRSLLDGQEYSVVCSNPGWTPCDVTLKIDGMDVGRWRIEARDTIVLERPAGVAKRFTFVKETSTLAVASGVTKHADNGLVSATFYPEVQKNLEAYGLVPKGMVAEGPVKRGPVEEGVRSYSSGATVLGGASSQKFGSASALYSIDYANVKTVNIRIVAREAEIPVTASLRSYPEAVLRGNPAPPRWEDFNQPITRE